MALEWSPVFDAASGLAWSPVFDVAGTPAIVSVTAGETTLTIAYSGPVTHYRVYEIGTAAPGWTSAGASPIVAGSLTVNTEYEVEVSANGSTVADSTQAGTLNPGSGGGPIPSTVENDFALSYSVLGSAQGDRALSYSVLGSAQGDRTLVYEIEEAGVIVADFVVSYGIGGAVDRDLILSYGVFANAERDLPVGYSVLGSVQGNLALTFDVVGGSSANLSLAYGIGGTADRDLYVEWAIFSGSGGADPAEVWAYVIEDGISAEQALRVILAALTGRTSGVGTPTEQYLSRDGTKPRITATFDAQGNRTSVAVDGS